MLENRYGTFVGIPCGLFSLDIGAKNARKIVFIASTRKSVFAAAALAIGGRILNWGAPALTGIFSVCGFYRCFPAPPAPPCQEPHASKACRSHGPRGAT